ncbi:recombination mediator RecR [Abyssibius alkaniclasticus]|uniref:recombination mediator RecR n=1 Tax=Abyssibius alkaniclasticus TaxID=2881234 RepID=UPI00236491B9|nr:recombination mediator RecR [Abyssibius alkaniclasticus]UPH71076.1 recombination mediator RecR [Abyssibius alkaniclasticus]|tara:strand:- start:246 stop:842 length:597 start_codon:yes stop_codon:yes gene_type:complete
MSGTRAVDTLIDLMARLPGLGPRSARRAVLAMIRSRGLLLDPLAQALAEVARDVRECVRCGNIATEDLCPICTDARRDARQLAVVQEVSDLWAMERTLAFKGRYFVLGGLLSALDGVTPERLRIPKLVRNCAEGVDEVILALSATIDGQTTAHYIAEQLAGQGITLTTLAQGVPVGGELDFLDDGTISAALRARKGLQ